MKIAVFTDIHGNRENLVRVMNQICEIGADRIVFLGDIFQRGCEEIECLELLRSSDITCLKGNCELYLVHGVEIDPDVEYLRGYYDRMRRELSEEQLQFIQSMPLYEQGIYCGHRICFSHFLCSDMNAPYPFLPLSSLNNGAFEQVCESESIAQYDLVVIGHSHTSFVKGNVVSVSAAGLESASYLLIEADAESLHFRYIPINSDQLEG